MILPHKYLNLEFAPLRVAAIAIQIMRIEPVISVRDLQLRVEDRIGPGAKFSLRPALNVLFLMGLVEYDLESDSLLLEIPVESRA